MWPTECIAPAARANAIGLEVLMLPQLAARLCGGFVEMAPPEVLFPLINLVRPKSTNLTIEVT